MSENRQDLDTDETTKLIGLLMLCFAVFVGWLKFRAFHGVSRDLMSGLGYQASRLTWIRGMGLAVSGLQLLAGVLWLAGNRRATVATLFYIALAFVHTIIVWYFGWHLRATLQFDNTTFNSGDCPGGLCLLGAAIHEVDQIRANAGAGLSHARAAVLMLCGVISVLWPMFLLWLCHSWRANSKLNS